MADKIAIDKNTFFNHLSNFYASWKADKRSGNTLFGGAGSIVILMGKTKSDESSFQKNNAMHFWLLGYEFPATLFVLTTEAIYVVTTAKKAELLEPLKGGKIPVELLVTTKDPESKTKAFEKCLEVIKGAGKKVGTLPKDTTTGPFADDWKRTFSEISKEVEEVDITPALSSAFAIKDPEELVRLPFSMRLVRQAC
jgi:Xaa-Pro aminopeptidase